MAENETVATASGPLRLYDNTRLSAFKRCPRYFFYRHVKHWTPDKISPALVFGASWHAAMDAIWRSMVAGDEKTIVVEKGVEAFNAEWTDQGMPSPQDLMPEDIKELGARTPVNAIEMIVGYVSKRWDMLRGGELEILDIERPFIVPLDPEDDTLFYIGKIDKTIRYKSKVLAMEHKTTTAYKKTEDSNKFRAGFVDSFSPNSQVDGYQYALHLTYPGEAGGVWVDAALVHKTEESFMFIPVEKRLEQLDLWLWETHTWIDLIEQNKEMAANTSPQEKYMAAFPKNTNSCWDFNQACPYLDLCRAWPNPQGHDIPPGMTRSVWNPVEHIQGLGHLVDKDAVDAEAE